MKDLKITVISIIVFVLFFAVVIGLASYENDYVHITALDYTAEVVDQIGSNGKVVITEKLTFDIHAADPDYGMWELWRDLPEEYVDGVKVEYNVLSVKRLTTNGQADELVFEESDFLYWEDSDYLHGANKWFHSKGPYDDYKNFECLLIYVDGLYREAVEFEIKYEMMNASMRFGDCSELYLTLYSGETIEHLTTLNGQILFPLDKMPKSENFLANTFGTNSHTFEFLESATKNAGYFTFYFSLDKSQLKFRPYNQYVEFSLVSFGNDKHIFTQYAPVNNYYNADVLNTILKNQEEYFELPQKYATTKLIVFGVLLALAGIIFLAIRSGNKRVERKHTFFKPEVDYPIYREIPSLLDSRFAAVLALCKDKLSDEVPGGYSAALLGLIKKGYVDVEKISNSGEWNKENTRIVILKTSISNNDVTDNATDIFDMASRNILTRSEMMYLKLIRKHAPSGSITLEQLQTSVADDFEGTDSFVRASKASIKKIGVEGGYFQRHDYKKLRSESLKSTVGLVGFGILVLIAGAIIGSQTRLDYAYGGFFILAFVLIATAVYNNRATKKFVLLSQFGENEYAKWKGLYNFLNNETLLNECEFQAVSIWEDYLIYATAFGISEKVINVMNVKFPEFVAGSSRIVHHPYLCSRMFTHTFSHGFSVTTSAASYVSRSGISGGYGGGGRGGGGGGGGH